MQTLVRIRLVFLLAIPMIVSIAGCGSTGDRLDLQISAKEDVSVGDTIDFKVARVVHDGTAYRISQVDDYEFHCEPQGSVSIDRANSKLTILKPGEIKMWIKATVEPVAIQKPYADWTSKTLKSDAVTIDAKP